jgi:hypothetical protein
MALVPNGKRRLMVAQSAPNPSAASAGELDMEGVQPGQTQMMDEQKSDPAANAAGPEAAQSNPAEDPAGDLEQEVEQQTNPEQGQEMGRKDGDVRQTVFDFLVGIGYPPRRLQEFKSQFVSETGSANSGTQVTLVLPDEVYGKNMQIPRDQLKKLVQTVEQKHGLSFQDYKRANEQLTLNFMTADAAQQQSLEDAGPGDILDKIYGKPGGGKGRGKIGPKGAQTIHEMIKEGRDRQFAILKQVLGERK